MRTLEEVIAAQSPESQAIIKAMADKMRLEIGVKTMNTVQIPTGTIKTFGLLGIPYEVGEPAQELPDGDILVNIILVQTGEKELYKLSKLLQDPDAE
ncbi:MULTISPECIES: DUF5397 family protein [Enterobacteriaceae]|jgi:hypothetical protein|uniref:DUF5397 family protein n=3 Tax=Enterobacteriaceae TaxID=543 RepID=A0AAP6B4B0_ECOLX|nr:MULTISPECIES: DUF5397 family protein [Enterobacteriaceae]EII22443.1 toxin-antitoxin system, antitoxin component, Xre domain protein [Escherichia coli 9.0111]EQQ19478.1 hypothetical protein G756_04948 [Escherichia coli HVH 95 (4-6074464)]EQQ60774.1 hypothetical protein G770_05252 [Escherichia coli HVH 109 (4-6977162)]MCA2044006.1 DUF5397 domain-containing protein [Escherichia coli]MCG4451261.1 DUF5397 domain-containing protein [Escherichia coli]